MLANRSQQYGTVSRKLCPARYWAQPEVLDLLAELDIGLANVDQPLFKRSIKPGAEVVRPEA